MKKKIDHNRSTEALVKQLQTRTLASQAKFLRAFAKCGNISDACKTAGIGARSTIGEWRKQDAFETLYQLASEDAADALESAGRKRAVDGVDEPVFYRGSVCGHIKRYSDALLQFLLKGRRPDVFRDRASVEHSGKLTLEQVLEASRSDGG